MWAALGLDSPDRLRNVPNPRETEPTEGGPAVRTPAGAYIYEPWEEMPRASPVSRERPLGLSGEVNRERELGLDRRETG